MSDFVFLKCVFLLPSNAVACPTAMGVHSVYGVGWVGGGYPSSAIGPGTQDQRLSANALTEKIPGEVSSSRACGGLSLFLSLFLSPSLSITVFAHSVHVTASTHHLIWEKLGCSCKNAP